MIGNMTICRTLIEMALDEEIFPDDWEFETLFGLSRNELKQFSAEIDFSSDSLDHRASHLVENIAANLKGYPHNQADYILEKYGLALDQLFLK